MDEKAKKKLKEMFSELIADYSFAEEFYITENYNGAAYRSKMKMMNNKVKRYEDQFNQLVEQGETK